MFIELIDSLRCLGEHKDTWLVAAMEKMDGRFVTTGSLGCPICGAKYAIVNGVADFRSDSANAHPFGEPVPLLTGAALEEQLLRVRALLDLGSDGGVVALTGHYCSIAPSLEAEMDIHTLLINPDRSDLQGHGSVILTDDRVALARGSLRAAIAGLGAGEGMIAGLANAIRPGGRLAAPAALPLPEGAQELARDSKEWVAELSHVGGKLAQLRRR